MKWLRSTLIAAAALLLLSSQTTASDDFQWFASFNIQAASDPGAFRTRLASRFQVDDAQITFVLSTVERPCDAYMVFYMGEYLQQPPVYVIERYKSHHHRGWGVKAQDMGIKPGSRRFHDMKRGRYVYDNDDHRSGHRSGDERNREKKREKAQKKGHGKKH